MDYSFKTDKLYISVTSENTFNNYDDGEIGKSFLWIINDLSIKKEYSAINPNRIIDLEEIDKRFAGHKIEGICILSESKNNTELLLASDDDDGKTILFKLSIPK
jgi:hypothetical protein